MDTDLVSRAQGGDQEAFADLVYAICYLLGVRPAKAFTEAKVAS